MLEDSTVTFYDIQKAFNDYWKDKQRFKGDGYNQFKRWENFAEPRVYPSGNLKYASMSMAYEAYQNSHSYKKESRVSAGNWLALGPFGSPIDGGAGRITFIRFHPTLPNTMYIGTAAGGLWYTADGGTTWNTNTNSMETLGFSDLAIDPVSPINLYLATGEIDGNDTYSVGIFKSTDGGITWVKTSLSWAVSLQRKIGRLLINPLRPNTLVAATSDGIYRTNDAGTTWNQIKTGNFTDIEYKPGDTSVVYAATKAQFFKSSTGGNTSSSYTLITAGITLSNIRACISVTPADPNYVYVLNSASDYSYGGIFRSVDSGTNFTKMSSTPNIFSATPGGSGGNGWYNLACGVSPIDKDEIICGGVNTWMSSDGGATWSLLTHWTGSFGAPYVHADVHAIEYKSGTKIFLGTDGGVDESNDSGVSWTPKNGTMNIAQLYRIGQSAGKSDYIISGHQDNGVNLLNGASWSQIYGGDGMDCFVDWSNDNTLVSSYVYGDHRISKDGGFSWDLISSGITRPSASWLAPIVQSPHDAATYYAGRDQVFETKNQGTTWAQLGTLSPATTLDYIKIAPSNSLVIYAGAESRLFKTEDKGVSWVRIDAGLPISSAVISDIAINDKNPKAIYVTLSGYSSTNKVYSSQDGGITWSNISAGLPNIPINCATFLKNSDQGIYVGTDVGVYFKDGTMSSFIPFMTGMPNIIVKELEIFYPTNKIRAATYARGVWESDLYYIPTNINQQLKNTLDIKLFPNPAKDFIKVKIGSKDRLDLSYEIYSITGQLISNGKMSISQSFPESISIGNLNKGMYEIKFIAEQNTFRSTFIKE